MTKEYQLDVLLKEKNTGTEAFYESYQIALLQNFVDNTTPKEHAFKNHVESFLLQLKKNNTTPVKRTYKKREVYVVSYGMNV